MKLNGQHVIPGPTDTIFFQGERTLFVDVDDTLVFMKFEGTEVPGSDVIEMRDFGFEKPLLVHRAHIEKIREFRARGIDVFVWSAGGRKWAQAVVCALGLDGVVNGVMGKPNWLIDDQDSKRWMGERFFLNQKTGASVDLEDIRK